MQNFSRFLSHTFFVTKMAGKAWMAEKKLFKHPKKKHFLRHT